MFSPEFVNVPGGIVSKDVSIGYFERAKRYMETTLTLVGIEKMSLKGLEGIAIEYSCARFIEAEAKFMVTNGKEHARFEGEMARWYKSFNESIDGNWVPLLEEIAIEADTIKCDIFANNERIKLANSLSTLYSRLATGI